MTHGPDTPDAREHRFNEVRRAERAPTQHLDIEDLKTVRLFLTVDLGHTSMLVREVLELQQGSVVRLNKVAGETTDIEVGGEYFARGEVVVIGDALHVRISEIVGAEEKPEDDVHTR
jgi:flagellar motor switch protein FliN/FliY